MRCQICGHENPQGGIYCEKCGAIVAGQARPDDSKLAGPKNEIIKAIESRKSLDMIMPAWIVWINILLSVGSTIGILIYFFSSLTFTGSDFESQVRSMFSAYGMVFVVGIVSQLIFATVTYFLIERHNNHASREKRLKNAVFALARAAATTPESQTAISRELQSLEYYVSVDQRPRIPALWAFLVALPAIGSALASLLFIIAAQQGISIGAFIGAIGAVALFGLIGYIATLYMFYFLMKEDSAHENSWVGFAIDSRRLLTRLGFPPGRNYELRASPDRSFALYLILTFITGIFLYYWWYVIIKDPNDHYRNQWSAEDSILDAIGR